MKALLCKTLDGHQNLTVEEVPAPTRASTEALIDVKLTALNFFDTLITKGQYQEQPPLPFSPGGEVAGVIREVPEGNSDFSIGDRVMAYTGWGGLQQQLCLPLKKLIKIPEGISDEVAASLMITYGTAMHGLNERAHLQSGQMVVILGAAGGAGLAALEVARAKGAKVIAVCSEDEKCQLTAERGADISLNSTTCDLKQELKRITRGDGVDVVYDCVGGDLAEPALRALKWNGHYLVVGFASGKIPSIPLNIIMLKGTNVQGVFLGRFIKEQPKAFKAQVQQLLEWAEAGQIKPHIHKIYPLAETVEALDQLASRKARGKILIQVS